MNDEDYEARWEAHCAKVRAALADLQPGEEWTPIPLPKADLLGQVDAYIDATAGDA